MNLIHFIEANNVLPFVRDDLRRWMEGILDSKNYDLYPLTTALLEVCNNIENHSEDNQGVIEAHFHEKHNLFYFIVGDKGIGIPNSLRKRDEFTDLSDKQALLKAMESGISSAKKFGRGEGLNYLKTVVRNFYKGELTITSGKVILHINFEGNEKIIRNEIAESTLIAISIKADKIPLRDENDFNVDASGDVWNV